MKLYTNKIRRRWKRDGTENIMAWEEGVASLRQLLKVDAEKIGDMLMAGERVESRLATFDRVRVEAEGAVAALMGIFKE